MAAVETNNKERNIVLCTSRWIIWRGLASMMLLFVAYVFWVNLGQAITMQLRSDDVVMDFFDSRAEFVWSAAMSTVIERHGHIIPALAARIRSDPSVMIRTRAANCCRRIAQFKPEAMPTLQKVAVPAMKAGLSDASLLVQVSCARALWEIDGNKDDLLPVLITAWRTGGKDDKYAVKETVQDMGSIAGEVAETLAASLDDPDPLIRQWEKKALWAIKHGDPRSKLASFEINSPTNKWEDKSGQ